MSLLPKLPTPQTGQLYARFTDVEFNCMYCPEGNNSPAQYPMTSHETWLYQSVAALQNGDICMFGGDFYFFDNDPANPYYPGGMLQALKDALSRGAKVLLIIDRYYTGGRDKNGNCGQCTSQGTPYDCDDQSTQGTLYGSWACQASQTQLQDLITAGGNNVITYDLSFQQYQSTPHSHCKLISFYLKSSNRISVFKGSWNLNTNPWGNNMKETGFGFISNMDQPFAQYHLWRDYYLLKIFENYYSSSITTPMSPYLKQWFVGSSPPTQPITVPTVFFCGADFCDPNFGCGASGAREAQGNGQGCTANERWLNGMDTNVNFTFGVDPWPQNNTLIQNWNDDGWPKEFMYGMTLLNNLIKGAKKYVKTSIHSQMLDAAPGNGEFSLDVSFYNTVTSALKNGTQWFVLQNDGWENSDPSTLINLINQDPSQWKNMYPKIFGVCGQISQGSSNTSLTHDKLWITDKAFLLSSAHPELLHYNWELLNEDLLVENCPNMLAYMNNHWNSLWNNCGFYTPNYTPQGPYTSDLGTMTCPDNTTGCCIGTTMNSKPKDLVKDPYGSFNICSNINCGANGTCDDNTGACVCSGGYTGNQCQTAPPTPPTPPVDPCQGVNCSANGTCVNGKCVCSNGYSGNTCQITPAQKKKRNTAFIIGICAIIAVIIIGIILLEKHVLIPIAIYIGGGLLILFISIATVVASRRTTTSTTSIPQPPPKPDFTEVKGIKGGGYCKSTKDSFPYWKAIQNVSQDSCAQECKQDSNCVAYDYNSGSQSCKLFSFTQGNGYDNASSNWQKEAGWAKNPRFPTYSSPYVCDPDPPNYLNCRTDYPDACTEQDGWACYVKGTPPDVNWWDPNKPSLPLGNPDSAGCQVVLSNPYIPSYLLLKTPGTFYFWLYNMITNANQFIILINTYITVFKHQSEDPDDYESQLYYAFVDALNRGVKITCVNVTTDQQQCQVDVATQPGIKEHLGGNLNYVDFSGTVYTFFHDKLYISENDAYIGGQNMSGSSSIDFGVSFTKNSSLYADLLQRAMYFQSGSNYSMNFKYTANNPYTATDSGAKYYIALSPYFPICQGKQSQNCSFPQQPCSPPTSPVGPYSSNNSWSTGQGNVSYEWHHLYNVIKNSKQFLFITNFDMSLYGDWFGEKEGTDWTIGNALQDAVNRGVVVDIWVNNMPFNDAPCIGNTTCNMIRCKETQAWLTQMEQKSNFNMHFWYQNPVGSDWNDYCNILHAKIYYSDYGVLISSSNFTPSYFGGTQDTGLCVVFGSNIPDWVSKGVKTIQNVLVNQSSVTSKGKTYICDNKTKPNFQTVGLDGKPLCDANNNCVNTCAQCGSFTQGSCGICQ